MFAPLASTPAPEPGHAPWPGALERTEAGLTFAGIPLKELASTPVYLVDETEARKRARAWVDAIGDGDVYYAGKALITPTIATWMVEEGLRVDTASEGELRTALAGGVPGDKIGLHGNSKSDTLLELALTHDVGRIVVDSLGEIDQLARIAQNMGRTATCFIRVTTGVHAGGHEFIATAHEDQKFGLSLATGVALQAAERIAAHPHLQLAGVHSHIGSQILDDSGFVAAAEKVIEFVAQLAARDIPIEEIDLGGGYGIQYTSLDAEPLAPNEVMARVKAGISQACATHNIPVPRLSIEPGRSIIGPAGITLYTVGAIKKVMTDDGVRTYVSVDGGMSDNPRPALYGANYTALTSSTTTETQPCRVVGMHCESGDIVVPDVALPVDIATGDLLVVAATGAYGRSMASNYNLVRRPGVLAVGPSGRTWLVDPESWDDLLGPLH